MARKVKDFLQEVAHRSSAVHFGLFYVSYSSARMRKNSETLDEYQKCE